ncbi:SRPBCC family protein [Arsenicicoccus dermatophilus]|uniref:SRPBCC family protein n=1 Tax=Arsenicicoccus dermatophilus TaxID=1076331 RepID=UPI001F4CE22C|nr:SRPBCC family protein [Arsenicicoccus dermatophilus]MCH8614139.1 SRPBCC family protein [Arsenicicoccus dermatophilus]
MSLASRLSASTGRSFTIQNTAWREAARSGSREVTLDHLLLALLVSGGPAAELLARNGVRLHILRRAVLHRHQADLRGLDAGAPRSATRRRREPRDRQRGVAGDIAFSPAVEQALKITPFTEMRLLAHLLEHPSGTPAEALRHAGVYVEGVLETAHAEADRPVEGFTACPPVPGLLDGLAESTTTTTRFVPVPIEHVWQAACDAAVVTRWFGWHEDVRILDEATLRTNRARGVPALELRRVRCELGRLDGVDTVAWQEFTPPSQGGDPRGAYVHLALTPMAGGTHVRLTRGFRGHGPMGGVFRRIGAALTPLSTGSMLHDLALVADDLGDRR